MVTRATYLYARCLPGVEQPHRADATSAILMQARERRSFLTRSPDPGPSVEGLGRAFRPVVGGDYMDIASYTLMLVMIGHPCAIFSASSRSCALMIV